MSARNRGDHGIELRNRPAGGSSRCDDYCERAGSVFVEWQDAACKLSCKDSFYACEQRRPTFAVGQRLNAIQNLREVIVVVNTSDGTWAESQPRTVSESKGLGVSEITLLSSTITSRTSEQAA
jgi:hypothetical protein